jgi:hypothetical protein
VLELAQGYVAGPLVDLRDNAEPVGERAAYVVQIGEDMRDGGAVFAGRPLELLSHAGDITGSYDAGMEVSRGERVAAWCSLVLLLGLLVIDLDVLTGGRLLGGRGELAGDEDQAVTADDTTSGD